jgi:apolipoprotein N-acyltransferase
MRERGRRVLLSPLTRAAIGGLLVATGGPPFPPACIALAFLGVVLFASSLATQTPTVGQGFVRGLFFGFAANVVAMSWVPATITRFTDLPLPAALLALVLLALGQGSVFAIAGAIVAFAKRVPFPLVFATGIGLSMVVPALFPWTIAAPFGRAPVFMQLAEVIGERGLSVLLALAAALVARAFALEAIERRRRLISAAAIFLGLLAYGLVRMPMIDAARASAPRRSVALVQQAVPPKERWQPELAPSIVTKLWSLTRTAQERGAELAIWPEAAYPYVLSHTAGRESGPFRVRGPGIHIDVVTGVLTEAPRPEGSDPNSQWHYNATTLIERDGRVAQPSAKIELLAFGEVVPLGDWFPALRRIFSRGGGLVPGKGPVLLVTTEREKLPSMRMGVLNCYEDTLGSVARRVMQERPNLLVNVTNDAWFGATAEPELHLLEAIPRAIEARRDLVRSVNTGVTAHIDANGRVVARAEREVATILLVEPRLLEGGPSLYVRFGDATWIALLFLGISCSMFAGRRRTWTSRPASP